MNRVERQSQSYNSFKHEIQASPSRIRKYAATSRSSQRSQPRPKLRPSHSRDIKHHAQISKRDLPIATSILLTRLCWVGDLRVGRGPRPVISTDQDSEARSILKPNPAKPCTLILVAQISLLNKEELCVEHQSHEYGSMIHLSIKYKTLDFAYSHEYASALSNGFSQFEEQKQLKLSLNIHWKVKSKCQKHYGDTIACSRNYWHYTLSIHPTHESARSQGTNYFPIIFSNHAMPSEALRTQIAARQ